MGMVPRRRYLNETSKLTGWILFCAAVEYGVMKDLRDSASSVFGGARDPALNNGPDDAADFVRRHILDRRRADHGVDVALEPATHSIQPIRGSHRCTLSQPLVGDRLEAVCSSVA